MGEEREIYKGKEIVIKTEEGLPAMGSRGEIEEISTVAEEGTEKKPELYIDGKHITTIRDRSGFYIASRLVHAPARSIKDIAKKLIDYEEAISSGR